DPVSPGKTGSCRAGIRRSRVAYPPFPGRTAPHRSLHAEHHIRNAEKKCFTAVKLPVKHFLFSILFSQPRTTLCPTGSNEPLYLEWYHPSQAVWEASFPVLPDLLCKPLADSDLFHGPPEPYDSSVFPHRPEAEYHRRLRKLPPDDANLPHQLQAPPY